MAGVTDTVFRRFIRNASVVFEPRRRRDAHRRLGASIETEVTNQQSGCGLIMTEFTSADGLARMRESKRKRYLTFYDDEHPISAQLFGSNPATLAEAAKIVEDTGFDMVDLNLGCPAKRVVACNGGSGLLRDLPLIGNIFEAVRAAVTIPFTVKFRLGWNDNQIVCVELARLAEECGLNAVALHARTREQGYSGSGALGVDRRSQGRGEDSRDRQRRRAHPRGRLRAGRGDRLRCRDDRARGSGESVDLSADRAVHGDRPLRPADESRPLSHDPDLLRDAARG